ncbi:MAG: carboxypeptidase regulatory-like domain-containing protein [Elusimicrobiota bacterium]|nr:carboxypeptidase regulatory-like domain-containing protein [Elusimicrobiota bacterium]
MTRVVKHLSRIFSGAPARRRARGTLVELKVAMVVMSVGVLGMIGAFKYFNVGVQSAKTRSLANNIAQERIEYLKNKSYYRVLVTTDPVSDDNFPAGEMVYDRAPNGQETVNVGGLNFIRRVYVRKVNEAADGSLDYLAWDEPDPGLKEVKVYVAWFERGEWRKLEIRNMRENPERVNLSASIRGTVHSSGGAHLQDVIVRAQENPSKYGVTDVNGEYYFTIEPGTYTLLATKSGYFTGTLSSFGVLSAQNATGKDFTLTQMNSGSIWGYAHIADRLVISQIVGSSATATGDDEWVEVYNPTTWTWTMATGLGTGANEVVGIRYKEKNVTEIAPDFDYRTVSLSSNTYFLFANTGTITAVGVTRQADAVYDSDSNWANQDNVIKTGVPSFPGGVILDNKVTGQIIDRVGWYSLNNGYSPDFGWYEVFSIYWRVPLPPYTENQNGLEPGMGFVRTSVRYANNPGEARCSDSNMNYVDFRISFPLVDQPNNSSYSEPCVTGQTADGALVFADDGLSFPVTASSYGYFNLVNVATGSWTVYLSSGVAFSSVAYYGKTWNSFSDSAGSFIRLSTITTFGYVTGRVANVYGTALPGIKMFSSGNPQVATDASGRYTLPVTAGVMTVIANYQSQSPSYVELSSADVNVGIGQAVKDVNFSLYYGGRIRGRITTNGTDPLPNIPVVGLKGGVEQGSGISGADGYFTISGSGVSTGTYVVVPQLEAGESSSPSSTTVTIAAGLTAFSSTYTISGAFGSMSGSVRTGSAAGPVITTGVLVYVTTATLAAGAAPPTINSALRGGTGIYYAASSNALGNYTIPVKGGYSYNVYAWYTTWRGVVPTTVRQESLAVSVALAEAKTANFFW